MSVLETTDTAAAGPVLVRRDGAAARITLNRPAQRNALSLQVMEEVTAALEALARDRDVRVIVIDAAGPAFCAGHDLGEMVDRDLAFYQHVFDICTVMMEAIHAAPQPVIARVHGIATAAGCQLVAACDLAVAAEEARFATPGVKIGLFCSTPMVPAVAGHRPQARARDAPDRARRSTPPRPASGGSSTASCRPTSWTRRSTAWSTSIAASSSLTVAIGKEAFYQQIDLDEPRAYDLTKTVMSMNMLAADAQEGICAFLEKRPPTWTGR